MFFTESFICSLEASSLPASNQDEMRSPVLIDVIRPRKQKKINRIYLWCRVNGPMEVTAFTLQRERVKGGGRERERDLLTLISNS